MIFEGGIFVKYVKSTEIYCENYFVVVLVDDDDDDDDDDDCDGGCNDNGDDSNGLLRFHKLLSSKMSIVSLKVFMVSKLKDYLYCFSSHLSISVALALFPVQGLVTQSYPKLKINL